MCSAQNLESDPESQATFLRLWGRLIISYTHMALTKPQDRTFAFQGITSHIARLSSRAASDCWSRISLFDGLPVPCLLPSLLWQANGKRPDQNITTDNARTRVESGCYVNTLSWASVEGSAWYGRNWPFCASASPRVTIFAPGFGSGTFKLKRRTQVVQLFAPRNRCGATEDDGNDETPVESSYEPLDFHPRGMQKEFVFLRYSYCTRMLSLIHVKNLLSRVTLEGPTFSFTTECTSGPSKVAPGRSDTFWDHPIKRNGLKNMFNLIWFDLAFLRFSKTRLAVEVTCLTVTEWEHGEVCTPTDVGNESPDSWQPNCAAGIVLIRSDSGGKDGEYGGICEGAREFYTRIGYWELGIPWDLNRPSYGPIREEAQVRRVVVI